MEILVDAFNNVMNWITASDTNYMITVYIIGCVINVCLVMEFIDIFDNIKLIPKIILSYLFICGSVFSIMGYLLYMEKDSDDHYNRNSETRRKILMRGGW